MSEFLWFHRLPKEVRWHISSFLERCRVSVLGYEPTGGEGFALMTIAEALKETGIMQQAMLDRCPEEFVRFDLGLVNAFTTYGMLSTADVFIGRVVQKWIQPHDLLFEAGIADYISGTT